MAKRKKCRKSGLAKIVEFRTQLLERLDKVNKQMNFVGSRGVELLTEKALEELVIKLEQELNEKTKSNK